MLCLRRHIFAGLLIVLPFLGTDISIEAVQPQSFVRRSNSVNFLRSDLHHWQFYLDKIAAKSRWVLCASSAIRIEWRNLRSIYHSWESQRLPATCLRKPLSAKFTPHLIQILLIGLIISFYLFSLPVMIFTTEDFKCLCKPCFRTGFQTLCKFEWSMLFNIEVIKKKTKRKENDSMGDDVWKSWRLLLYKCLSFKVSPSL